MRTETKPPVPRLSGRGYIAEDGKLHFALDSGRGCTQVIVDYWCETTKENINGQITCLSTRSKERTRSLTQCAGNNEGLALTLIWPWGTSINSKVDKNGVATFELDWSAVAVDPLAADATRKLVGAWRIIAQARSETIEWQPLRSDLGNILAAIGRVRNIDISVDPNAPPAKVSVKALTVADGKLVVGKTNRIELTLHNEGPGPAYRVVGFTRSSYPLLHGLQFSFGRIDAGATATRSLDVTLQEAGNEANPMVVVSAAGTNATETRHSQRLSIAEPVVQPLLPLLCNVEGQANQRPPVVHPGQTVTLSCEIRNPGKNPLPAVQLTAEGAGSRVSAVAIKRARPKGSAHARLKLEIPPDAPVGTIAIVVSASAPEYKTTQVSLPVQLAHPSTPNACPDGKLTRAQYEQKRSKLQSLLKQGALSQSEFDQYDAELVGCLE